MCVSIVVNHLVKFEKLRVKKNVFQTLKNILFAYSIMEFLSTHKISKNLQRIYQKFIHEAETKKEKKNWVPEKETYQTTREVIHQMVEQKKQTKA